MGELSPPLGKTGDMVEIIGENFHNVHIGWTRHGSNTRLLKLELTGIVLGW